MSKDNWFLLLIIAAAHWHLMWHRLLAYMRYFQQEGYEHLRFLRWVHVRSLADPALWLSLGCTFLLSSSPNVAVGLFVAGTVLLALVQPDPRRSGKISLKLTWRAIRVVAVSFGLAVGIWMALVALVPWSRAASEVLASGALYAVAPLILIIANASLAPYEQSVRRSYEAEAVGRVQEVHALIIGITGSYGKSSTKAILAHILQYKGPTLAASGSINTLMGVTRHIREELVVGHEFMVVEMGAFKTGSIRRLCQLTPPSAAIITAVGDMHLERFGSTAEIVRAKGELAEALPPGGVLVVNADSPGALQIAQHATNRRVLLYGEHSAETLDTRLEEVTFSRQGSSFTLRTHDRAWACFTPLLGRPIILNIAGAFTLACAIGVDPEIVVAALRTLRPVSNRLEVTEERGVTWIRDAYNSNQYGFRAALEVATALPANRRFLATPGVIELGPEQFDVNRTLAREASEVCETTLVVSDTNREAFVAGFRDARRDERLVAVQSRGDAFRWLGHAVTAGDAVILENDLPDLYERSAGLFWKFSAR